MKKLGIILLIVFVPLIMIVITISCTITAHASSTIGGSTRADSLPAVTTDAGAGASVSGGGGSGGASIEGKTDSQTASTETTSSPEIPIPTQPEYTDPEPQEPVNPGYQKPEEQPMPTAMVLYALGDDGVNVPISGWGSSLPESTGLGTYYVWRKVVDNMGLIIEGPSCTKYAEEIIPEEPTLDIPQLEVPELNTESTEFKLESQDINNDPEIFQQEEIINQYYARNLPKPSALAPYYIKWDRSAAEKSDKIVINTSTTNYNIGTEMIFNIIGSTLNNCSVYISTYPEPETDDEEMLDELEEVIEEEGALYTGTWGYPVFDGTWSVDEFGNWYYSTTQPFVNTWAYIYNPYAMPGLNLVDWFYFNDLGIMLYGWQEIDGIWYYLNPIPDGTFGACLIGPAITPDGYLVDETGAWVPSEYDVNYSI